MNEQMSASTPDSKPDRRGTFWLLFPVVLLGSMVSGLIVMARIAVDDPGFAVESDYYRKAIGYEGEIQQHGVNARLGWQARGAQSFEGKKSVLTLAVSDRTLRPLSGLQVSVEAFPNARAAEVTRGTAAESAPGQYRFPLDHVRTGLWEVRLKATRGLETFTETLRLDLRSSAPSGAPEAT